MDITITLLNGESRSLNVNPTMTVDSLKMLIFQKFEVPQYSQKLLYSNGGQNITLDDPAKTLLNYGLPANANILVLVTEPTKMQVFLKTEKGQTHTYTVMPRETVEGFKLKVRQREGVAEDQQRLIHEGKQMDNGHTLEDYNVKEHSTIFLTGRLRGG